MLHIPPPPAVDGRCRARTDGDAPANRRTNAPHGAGPPVRRRRLRRAADGQWKDADTSWLLASVSASSLSASLRCPAQALRVRRQQLIEGHKFLSSIFDDFLIISIHGAGPRVRRRQLRRAAAPLAGGPRLGPSPAPLAGRRAIL